MQSLINKLAFQMSQKGIKQLPFNGLKNHSGLYRRLLFLVKNAKHLEMQGNGVFFEKDLNLSFPLDDVNLINMEYYYRLKKEISFEKIGNRFYGVINGLKIQIPFPSGLIELEDTFLKQEYNFFDVKNANVLDVGAYIGDTAIYFAMQGAKKIVGYEPIPQTLEIAKHNVALNHLENTVKLCGEAIGTERGCMKINYVPNFPGMSSLYMKSGRNVSLNVDVKPFNIAVDELGHVDLLKMDCEGAEWQVIPKAVENGWLRNVDKIIMEVHQGGINVMQKLLLKAGFKTDKVKAYFNAWLLAVSKRGKEI